VIACLLGRIQSSVTHRVQVASIVCVGEREDTFATHTGVESTEFSKTDEKKKHKDMKRVMHLLLVIDPDKASGQ
jgi:hypothetical protein